MHIQQNISARYSLLVCSRRFDSGVCLEVREREKNSGGGRERRREENHPFSGHMPSPRFKRLEHWQANSLLKDRLNNTFKALSAISFFAASLAKQTDPTKYCRKLITPLLF